TSNFTDDSTLIDEEYCYLVMPVGGTPPSVNNSLGFSDFLCLYSAPATGSAPGLFTARLDQTNIANLTWTGPGGQTGYELTVSKFDGSANQVISIPGGLTAT